MDLADRDAMAVKYDGGGGERAPSHDCESSVSEVVGMINGLAARYN